MNIDREDWEILSQRYGFSEDEIMLALEEYDNDVESIVSTHLQSLIDIVDKLCYVGDDVSGWFTEQRENYLKGNNVPEDLWNCIDTNKFDDTFMYEYSTTEHCVWD